MVGILGGNQYGNSNRESSYIKKTTILKYTKVFVVPGTYLFYIPPGIAFADLYVRGGGGGGGAGQGAGGGGGADDFLGSFPVINNQLFSLIVGAAGLGGIGSGYGGTATTAGGTSSISSNGKTLVTANGGQPASNSGAGAPGSPGAGGLIIPVQGHRQFAGGNGGICYSSATTGYSGSAGIFGSPYYTPGVIGATTASGNIGGSGGAAASYIFKCIPGAWTNGLAGPAGLYGGGGSGGGWNGTGSPFLSGGNGGAGVVIAIFRSN